MKTITTTLTTEAIFSDDGNQRYLLKKTWDKDKPSLAIIMLAPSEASGIALDSTTLLVLNNACRLGYGSVAILNLFSTLNDYSLKCAEGMDIENTNIIVASAKKADTIVYAPGVGKSGNKDFITRQEHILTSLLPMQDKLHCLCNANGHGRLQHPLSPAVRTWTLSPLKVSELVKHKPREILIPAKKENKRNTSSIKPSLP